MLVVADGLDDARESPSAAPSLLSDTRSGLGFEVLALRRNRLRGVRGVAAWNIFGGALLFSLRRRGIPARDISGIMTP